MAQHTSSDASEPSVGEFAAPATAATYVRWPPPPPERHSSRRRTLMLLAAAGAGSLVLAVVCAGIFTFSVRFADGDYSGAGQPPPPAQAPTFAQPTGRPFAGTYTVPANLCEAADFTRLRPLFNDIGDISATTAAADVPTLVCDGSTGNEQANGAFRLTASTYPDPGGAKAAFYAKRDLVTAKVAKVADITGVGQAAYGYFDDGGGHSVTALDSNLIVSMTWQLTGGSAPPPTDVITTLRNVIRSTLVVLRYN